MKHRIILLICAIAFSGITGTASNRKANRYFELYKYSKAIPLYKKSVLQGNQEEQKEATFRLADCYRLTNDVKEARSWYARAISMYDAEPVHYFYLGQALRSLGEYEEAETNFLKYAELQPGDPRGEIFARYCREIRELEPLDPSVEISNATSLNSKFYDFAPVYYKDGILIASDRSPGLPDDYVYEWTSYGYLDLYFSKPTYYNDFWTSMSEPRRVSELLNQTWHDGPVSFSSDFKTIFLTRTTKSKVKRDEDNFRTSLLKIYIGEVSDNDRIKFTPFPHNSKTYSVGHPTVSADGTKVIFSSDMPGGFGGTDLYISEKSGEEWSSPRNLGPMVNSLGNEVFPFWYNDSTLYFASDGHMGYGGLDLFESQWDGQEWRIPENMREPLNSPFDDFGIVFRSEKMDGFFSSNRPGGLGADDIYAIRNYTKKPVQKEKPRDEPGSGEWLARGGSVCGYVKEKGSLQPLEDASVFVMNSRTNQVIVLKTDREGFFSVAADSAVLYVAKAMKPGYFDDCLHFRYTKPDPEQCTRLSRELLLDKVEVNKIFVVENIYYDLDKWHIRADAIPALDNLVRLMKEYPIAIELSSHTDSRASREYNDELSQKRAEAAVRYIILKGVNAVRLLAQGYGETRLVNRCADGVPCSEAEHQANRRTEFKILDVQSEYFWKKPFDPSLFKANETIPLQMLDPDFFKGCLLPAESSASGSEYGVNSVGLTRLVPATPVKAEKTESSPAPAESAKIERNLPASGSGTSPEAVVAPRKFVATAPVDNTSPADDTFYTVQILATLIPMALDSNQLKGETGIFEKRIGEYYKYFSGTFSNYNAASSKRKELASKFPGCFLVGFREGNVVPLSELKTILK